MTATAMLFAPPLPPLRLDPAEPAVIGRSRRCALSVSSRSASRCHAEVAFDGTGYVVRDLGSTNGTFVNGRLVEGEHALAPGDRIDVGGSVVTFCQVDSGLPDPDDPREGQTLLFEHPRPGQAEDVFRGDLAEIPPYAVLQVLELGCKTGALRIESGERKGSIWLVDGAPVHADGDGQTGFDAAIALARAETGRFAFEPGELPSERTIDASVTQLLLEASCLEDEESRTGV